MMNRLLIRLRHPFRRGMLGARWMTTSTTSGNGNTGGSLLTAAGATSTPFINANSHRGMSISMKKNSSNGKNSGGKDEASSSPILPPPPRQPPETLRRLVVQRKQQQDKDNRQGSGVKPPPYIYRRTRRPSMTETRDTAGQLILQQSHAPPSNLAKLRARRPPVLNTAVWLDTTRYIKQSSTASTTKSGTEGARRLLRGRDEWLKAVRKHVQRNNGKATEYTLTGHGVPRQLLQHVVQYWHVQYQQATTLQGSILEQVMTRTPKDEDTDTDNDNNHGRDSKYNHRKKAPLAIWELHATSSGAAPIAEPLHVQRALVRRVVATTPTSITHRLPITSFPSPFDAPNVEDDDESPENRALALYLTVMHRVASTLAVVVQNGDDEETDISSTKSSSSPSSSQPPQPGVITRWHVVVAPDHDDQMNTDPAPHAVNAGDPTIAVAWHGPRQICVHLYGKSVDDEIDEEDVPVLRIVYQAQIQRPYNTAE